MRSLDQVTVMAESDLTQPTISWVIPFVRKDLKYLPGLVRSLNAQTEQPNKVLLVSSGLNATERRRVDVLLADLLAPYEHLWRRWLHHAGNARNFGARHASTDCVSFFDADDFPHWRRNELIRQAMHANLGEASEVAVYHGYVKLPRETVDPDWTVFPSSLNQRRPKREENYLVLANVEIDHHSPWKSYRRVVTTPHPLVFLGAQLDVNHGHPTVTSSTLQRVRFPSRAIRRGEDIAFAWRLNKRVGLRVVMIDLPLTAYRNHWSEHVSKRERFERRHPARRTRVLIRIGKLLRESSHLLRERKRGKPAL